MNARIEKIMDSVCLSGGCVGADIVFGDEAEKAGHEVVHFGFGGMYSKRTLNRLSHNQLVKADPYLMKANEILGRTYPSRFIYTNNLLRRNYYQIAKSKRVYAVSTLLKDGKVAGGTGWAVAMAIQKGIEDIYFFEQEKEQWFKHEWREGRPWKWKTLLPPKPDGIYTGIGSSKLNGVGEEAIRDLYDGQ
jgi:hypothetical protein